MHVGRHQRLHLRLYLGRQGGEVEPDALAEIEAEAPNGARIGHHAGLARLRRREAGQDREHVEQFVRRLDQRDSLVAQDRLHHRVVAGERAGVRLRGRAPAGAGAGMQQDDRDPPGARAACRVEKQAGIANLLDIDADGGVLRIADQDIDEMLGAQRRLVAGGDHVGHVDAPRVHGEADIGGRGAALRHNRDPSASGRERADVHGLEGQRNTVGIVRVAHAVGAEQRDAAVAAKPGEFVLLLAAFVAGLREARRKHDHGAYAALRAGAHRIEDRRLRHDEHGDVHAPWQVADRLDAGPAPDLVARAADEMDFARIAEGFEIGEDAAADRRRFRLRADDRDRARPQQPVDIRGCRGRCGQRRGFSPGHRSPDPA